MTKISAFALLLCIAFNGNAANWKLAGVSTFTENFIDVDSIKLSGNYRKAWIRSDYGDARETSDYPKAKFRSMKHLDYFDCEMRTTTSVQQIMYSDEKGNGEVVRTQTWKFVPSDLSDVVPDSVGETNLETVCSHQLSPKKQNKSNFMDTPRTKK